MEAKPRDDDCFRCVMLIHFHGTVLLQPATPASNVSTTSVLEGKLGVPYEVTALPLSDIGGVHQADEAGEADEAGAARPQVVCVVAPPNLGYSVMGSENLQFLTHTQAFIQMVSGSRTCLNGREIARFFDLYDDKLYSFFDTRFNKQLQDFQTRFLARTPAADLDFTKKLVMFYSDEMPKHDFNSSMQLKRQSAELFWKTHYTSCIREKLYCPGTHANQCSLYFPGVDDTLLEKLKIAVYDRRPSKKQKSDEQKQKSDEQKQKSDDELFEGLSIQFSSDYKLVLTIIFENDPVSGLVKNERWRGISLDRFFQQITQYLHFIFDGVKGFDGVDDFDLNALMSRTCVIDTACSDFSVPVKNVSIISFDRAAGAAGAAGEGIVSALVDLHDDPGYQTGFWEYWINRPPRTLTPTHSQHRVSIPRELEEYVPGCLACNNTIKSVEPIFDDSGKVVSVVYTYHDGHQETIAYQPHSSDVVVVTDSMGGVKGDSAPPVISDDDSQTSPTHSPRGASGGVGNVQDGGRRIPLHTTRRVRSLRNKSKTKRGKKIRRITNSRTWRGRGRGRGLRRTRRR